ncbi:MAG: DUF5131 family protein, partial [Terriglobales bacterium]
FNPWRGCSKISPGCAHCYAETMSKRNPKVLGVWGNQGTRPSASESSWHQPLRWNRLAEQEGRRHRVFCASLADVCEDRRDFVGPRARLKELILDTPWLTWQLLSKRPEHFSTLFDWTDIGGRGYWPENVWAMTSVENQEYAGRRIPELLRVPAHVRGLSVEPLLGPINLRFRSSRYAGNPKAISWVIIGGESGPRAQPCHLDWIRDLIRQCQEARVACFVKQLGSNIQGLHLRDRKGGDPAEWPEDLRVREFPASVNANYEGDTR